MKLVLSWLSIRLIRHGSIAYTPIRLLTPSFDCSRHGSIAQAILSLLTSRLYCLRHDSTADDITLLLTPSFDGWRQMKPACEFPMVLSVTDKNLAYLVNQRHLFFVQAAVEDGVLHQSQWRSFDEEGHEGQFGTSQLALFFQLISRPGRQIRKFNFTMKTFLYHDGKYDHSRIHYNPW